MAIAPTKTPNSLLPGAGANFSQLLKGSSNLPNTMLVYKDVYLRHKQDSLDAEKAFYESARILPVRDELMWGVKRLDPIDPRDKAPIARYKFFARNLPRADPAWISPLVPTLTTYVDHRKVRFHRKFNNSSIYYFYFKILFLLDFTILIQLTRF